jgi:uncharacterized protein (TIGR02284 family)
MATQSESIVDSLKELTEFVNDGIAGYERAVKETKNPQFETYYQDLVQQRRTFANELNALIGRFGGAAETDTTIKGKFFRQWMDIKAAFTDSDERAILDSNMYGEEWAQKAFNDALDNPNLPMDVRQLLERQRQLSTEAYRRQEQMKAAMTS